MTIQKLTVGARIYAAIVAAGAAGITRDDLSIAAKCSHAAIQSRLPSVRARIGPVYCVSKTLASGGIYFAVEADRDAAAAAWTETCKQARIARQQARIYKRPPRAERNRRTMAHSAWDVIVAAGKHGVDIETIAGEVCCSVVSVRTGMYKIREQCGQVYTLRRGAHPALYFADQAHWAAATTVWQQARRGAARAAALVLWKQGQHSTSSAAKAVAPAPARSTLGRRDEPWAAKPFGRYSVDPAMKIVGGFATLGMGRYLDEATA